VITNPRERGGHSPRCAADPKKIIIIYLGTVSIDNLTLDDFDDEKS
jgi:hypothetical protein